MAVTYGNGAFHANSDPGGGVIGSGGQLRARERRFQQACPRRSVRAARRPSIGLCVVFGLFPQESVVAEVVSCFRIVEVA